MSIFHPVPRGSQMLCEMSDFTRFPLPEYVKLLPRKARRQWMEDNGVRRVVPDQHVRLPERLASAMGMGSLPSVRAAYSMFEMMQPFMIADAPAITTGSSTKTALTQDLIFTLNANTFAFPGKRLWFHAVGVSTNVVTTPGTWTFTLNWGGSAGTVLATTGAIAPWPVVNTNTLWVADFYLTARATGALTSSLTLTAYGQVTSPSWLATVTQLTNAGQLMYAPPNSATPGTALADVTGLDQTVNKALTLAVINATTTGSIACRDAFIVAMN